MERESFIFYKSFYEAIRDLPDNIRLEVFTAITEYALYGKQPEDLKPFARGMFTLIKPNLDSNLTRYENGKKGGRKPRQRPSRSEAEAEGICPSRSEAEAEGICPDCAKAEAAGVLDPRPGGSKVSAESAQAEASEEEKEYSSFEEEVAKMKADRIWCEPVCMQFKIDQSDLHARLDAFATHCKVERRDKLHPSLKDARRHFTSWMRKAYPTTEKKITEQPKPDDYTFNGGFGGLD